MKKKYLVIPGNIFSFDGDVHYISANVLIKLYGVNKSDCIIANEYNLRGLKKKDYIILKPSGTGDYELSGD